jgi:hypothetical protein
MSFHGRAMSSPDARSTTPGNRRRPRKERRKPPGAPGSMRWLGGMLARPLAIETGAGGPRVVLVERRKNREPSDRVPTVQICEQLRSRLVGHQLDNATRVMRHLVLVHDQLATKGWAAVAMLPGKVLERAVVQCQMLATDEASPALAQLADRLRVMKVEAELREERQRNAQADRDVEVIELSEEEFQRSAQRWQDSQLAPESEAPLPR